MKTKKLIHYRLGVSRQFPATHPRKGQRTQFVCKILHAINDNGSGLYDKCQNECGSSCGRRMLIEKLHTIRANYELWAKRFEKINKGEAVLELYYWSGKPYNSKQVVFATLTKDDGIGIQKILLGYDGGFVIARPTKYSNEVTFPVEQMPTETLAKNDGLSQDDFMSWFAPIIPHPLSARIMVIIHFTSFRY